MPNFDSKTFQITNTPIEITGNFKIVVDQEQRLYLSVFDTLPGISDTALKTNLVNSGSDYGTEVAKLYRGKNLPIEAIYTRSLDIVQYQTGLKSKDNQYFRSKNSIFAPLYVQSEIPENFVILRIPKDLETDLEQIHKSQIVKIVKIKDSEIGDFLLKSISEMNHIDVNFGLNQCSFNGFSLNDGSISSMVEDIEELYTGDKTVSDFENHISAGFSRNELVSSKIFNFEFMFDELDPDFDYTFFYSDFKDIGTLITDKEFLGRYDIRISKHKDSTSEIPEFFINSDFNFKTTGFTGVNYIPQELSEKRIFSYIKDVDSKILKLNGNPDQYELVDKIRSNQVYGFTGRKSIKCEIIGAGPSVVEFDVISEMIDGFRIEIKTGSKQVAVVYGESRDFEPGYGPALNYFEYFYPKGSGSEIAKSISLAFTYSFLKEGVNIKCFNVENRIYIYSNTPNGELRIELPDNDENIEFENLFLTGGSGYNRIKVDSDVDLGGFTSVKIKGGYQKIGGVSKNYTNPIFNSKLDIIGFESVNDFKILTFSKASGFDHSQGILNFYKDYEPTLGVMSIYPTKNLNIDTKENRTEQNFYEEIKQFLQPDKLIIGQTYQVTVPDDNIGNDSLPIVNHNSVSYLKNSSFVAINEDYQILQPNACVINLKYIDDPELDNFTGFTSFSNIKTLTGIKNIFASLNEIISDSEYSESETSIAKWVSDNLDIKSDPTRLDINEKFGVYSFSPSYYDESKKPEFYTHEWYNIQKLPNLEPEKLFSIKNYIGNEFDLGRYKSTTIDHFTEILCKFKHMIGGDPVVAENQIFYSEIIKRFDDVYSTHFKGVKLGIESESDLSGYKYSNVLNFLTGTRFSNQNFSDVTVYKNEDHKNILVNINVYLEDYKIFDTDLFGSFFYLYLMQHLQSFDGTNLEFGKSYDLDVPTGKSYVDDSNQPITNFQGSKFDGKINYINPSSPKVLQFDDDLNESLSLVDNEEDLPQLVFIKSDGSLIKTCVNPGQPDLNFESDTSIISVGANSNELLTNGISIFHIPEFSGSATYNPVNIHQNLTDLSKFNVFIEGGGKNLYLKLSSDLSFSRIISKLENKKNIKEYTIKNGEISEGIDFIIKYARPTPIQVNGKKLKQIFRYSDSFNPKFDKLVKFIPNLKKETLSGVDLPLSEINLPLSEFSDIENFNSELAYSNIELKELPPFLVFTVINT